MAAVTIPVIAAIVVLTVLYYSRAEQRRAEGPPPAKPEAPPDLEKLREKYTAGVDAILRNDPASAVRYLSSFTFGPRAVEEYRLYYLAGGQRHSGSLSAARVSLTHLWSRNPRMVFADDAGLELAGMHAAAGDAIDSALVYDHIAERTDNSGRGRRRAMERIPATHGGRRHRRGGSRRAAGSSWPHLARRRSPTRSRSSLGLVARSDDAAAPHPGRARRTRRLVSSATAIRGTHSMSSRRSSRTRPLR